MFKKNLLKRTLPILLSVAMTLQSVPLTAMAAESDVPVNVAESVIDETVDDAHEADSVLETDIIDSVSEFEETTSDSDSEEETHMPETKEDNSEEADTALTDEVNDDKEIISTDDALADEEVTETTAAKTEGTVISIDYTGIQEIVGGYDEYSYDVLTKTIVAEYSEDSSDAFGDILGEIKGAIKFLVDNSDKYDEMLSAAHAEYKWQKKNEAGAFTDMAGTEFPVNAGDYKLVISLPAVEGVCSAAEDAALNFRIDKKSVPVKYDGSDKVTIAPGTTVKDAKADILDNYSFTIDGVAFNKENNNRSICIESAAVVIKDAYNTAEALGDDTELLKNGDYTLDLELMLKSPYKENYEFENTHLNVVMSDAFETKIVVTYTNQDGSDIGKVFDDQAISEEEVKSVVKAVVTANVDVNGNGVIEEDEWIDIADAEIVYGWEDADGNELTGAGDVKDAGTYYYVVKYEGVDGKYQPSEEKVTVVIQTADIVIEPSAANAVIYEGVQAKDVLSTLDIGYKVYKVNADGTKGDEITVKDNPYFWGVSYNQDGATQSYEPTFAILKVTETSAKVKGEDGKETLGDPVTAYKILSAGEEIKLEDEDTDEFKKTVTYKLIFSGKKAVYNGSGYVLDSNVDINASQNNYRVDCSNDALYSNKVDLDVKSSENVVIDVEPMYGENKAGNSYDNAITSTYNAAQLFGNRSEYKKAKVTNTNEGTELPASDTKYTWQMFDHTTKVFVSKDENGELEKDKKGNLVDSYGNSLNESELTLIKESEEGNTYEKAEFVNWSGYNHNLGLDITPSDAGDYRIKVSYDTKKYHAEPKYVYYTIQKKNVLVKVNETPALPTAYAGGSISTYLDMIEAFYDSEGQSYVGHKVVGCTLDENGKPIEDELPQTLEEYRATDNSPAHTYWLDWHVKRLIKDGPDQGNWEDAYGTFIKGETYRLFVSLEFTDYDYNDSNNYNNCYKLDKHNNIVYDEDGNPEIAYENGHKDIPPVAERTGINVTVNVDWSKVVSLTKVYDGKTLSIDDTKIKEAVTFTNPQDGSVIPSDEINAEYIWYWEDEGTLKDADRAIHAGTYYLIILTDQTDKYLPVYYNTIYDNSRDKEFVILPRELTVTPNLRDDIMAGEYISSSAAALCASVPTVKGYEAVEADIPYFEGTYEGDKTPVSSKLLSYVYYKNGKQFRDGRLRSNEQYYVMNSGKLSALFIENTDIQVFYPTDYKLVFEAVEFTPLRKAAIVDSTAYGNIKRTRLYDDISGNAADDYTHTITSREGIEYSKNLSKELFGKTEGNYFVFKITAPAEYIGKDLRNTAVYENSIKAAGGYLLKPAYEYRDYREGDDYYYGNMTTFTVAFDASVRDKKNFEIIWEDGDIENFTVDFSTSILLEDFSKAVAPKSISFNGAVTKMVIGENQQLDLKITKKQMSDIICVQYESSDTNVLSVSESGYVTALKKGTATVSAYPSYEDADGNKLRLTDAKGKVVKGASVKITVSEVTAVKSIKTEAHDTYAYISYKNPVGGYRREIYVLEMSSKSDKKKVDNFETEISKVVNGKYDAFAAAPVFITKESAKADYNGHYARISGLEPNKQYAVYVRNVSGLRTLVDGSEVANSHAGTVSTFTTTKAQEKGLRFSEEKNRGYWNEKEERYEISVTDKKVPLYFEARFDEYDSYADEGDYRWFDLPLSKDDQQKYVDPKLAYYVSDTDPYIYHEEDWIGSKPVIFDGLYDKYAFTPSKLATIDKKGIIKPKGVGHVYIIVINSVTKHWTVIDLYITAKADTLTGKPIKMKVGTSVRLTDYLTYKQGKTTLTGYCNFGLQDLTVDTPSNADFDIKPYVPYGDVVKDYIITAKNPTKGKFTINVRDNAAGASTSIVLQASAIDPVKNLKANNVVDKRGYISFTYSALGANETLADGNKLTFRIEVKDSSGKIMENKLINPEELRNNNAQYKTPDGDAYADVKHSLYQYEYRIDKLTRLSNYTVSVSAVYGEHESKAASTKIKTTNIPASYADLNAGKYSKYVDDFYYYDNNGELVPYNKDISVTINSDKHWNDLSSYPILKSGNTYTLDFNDIADARLMKTDTLTWKSSNTKVAAVKANAGTFTAELKAAMKGSTIITVTSKVTRKVIAKWEVFVNAVGEAEGYYGDNIRDRYGVLDLANDINPDYIGILGADVLTLNNNLSIELTSGEGRWVAFTAPEYGKYSISSTLNVWVYDDEFNSMGLYDIISGTEMRKGEHRYMFLENTYGKKAKFTLRAQADKYYTTADMGSVGTKVKNGSTIVFIAPEDNYYTLTLEVNGSVDETKTYSHPLEKGEKYEIPYSGLDSTKDYVLKITSRQPEAIALDSNGDANKSVTLGTKDVKWYEFTAPEAGKYIITATSTSQAGASLFNSIMTADPDDTVDTIKGEEETSPYFATLIEQGFNKVDKLYIRLTSTEDNNVVNLEVKRNKTVEEGKDQTVTAKDGEKQYVTYTVPSDGDYRFTAEYKEADGLDVNVEVSVNGAYEATLPQEKFTLNENDLVTFEISAYGVDEEGNPLSADVTIGVEKIAVEPITIDETQSVKVSDNVYERRSFTADKDGWYRYSFTVSEKTAPAAQKEDTATTYVPNVTVEVQKNGEVFGSLRNNGAKAFDDAKYFKAGDVITLVIKGSEADTTVSAKVAYEAFEELKAGPNTVTLAAGETKRYKWTASEGLYDFTTQLSSETAEVTVKKSSKSDDEGYVISNDLSELSRYMNKGETNYLTISSNTDTTVTYTITVTATEVKQLIANANGTYTGSYTLKPGAEQWVELTARTTNRYVYSVENGTAQKYRSLKASSGTPLPVEGDVYDAGEKQLFKLTNTDSEADKTVTLTISPAAFVEFTAASAGTKTGVKSKEGIWFRFKADAGNKARYKFTLEAKRGEDNVNAYITRYTSDILVNGTNDYTTELSYQLINAGAYYYIFVEAPQYEITEENNKTIDVTLKAEKLAANETEKLTLDVTKSVALKAGVPTYLEFTADKDGKYTFTTETVKPSSDEATVIAPPTVEYYKNLSTSYVGRGLKYTIDLVKGDKILVKLTSVDDQSVNVTVHEEDIKDLAFDTEETITVKNGEVKYFRINSSESCRYYVEAYDVADGLSITRRLVSGPNYYPVTAVSSEDGFYYSFVGEVGQKQIFTVTAAISDLAPAEDGTQQKAPESLTFKIKAGVVKTESIEAGTSKTINTAIVKPYHMTWYSFKPTEAGRYTIKPGTPSTKVRRFAGSIQTLNGSDINFPYDEVITESQVGKEITYAVYYTDAKAANFDFSINKTTVNELTVTSPVPVSTSQVNENIWVKFTAPADGRYTFTNTNTNEVRLYTSFYESIDSTSESYYDRFTWGDEVCLDAEDEIIFAVHYTEAIDKAFNISVSSVTPAPLTVAETGNKVEFSNDNAKWFVFKAPSDAIYQFDVTAELEGEIPSNVSMYCYAKLNDLIGVSMSTGDTYGMEKDSEVYIRLQPSSAIPEDGKLNVSIQITKAIDITKLNLAENPDIEVAANSEKWLCFTAEKAGFYKFINNSSVARSGSVDIYKYNDINGYGDSWDDLEFDYGLNKGESIYFKLVNNSAEEPAKTAIAVSMKSEVKELAVSSSDSIGNMTSNDEAWYVFTAPGDGMYNISAGNDNVHLDIYTNLNDSYPIGEYDGSYLAGFSKGEVIYIRVYTTYWTLDNVTISCATVVEKEFFGEDQISFVLGEGESALLRWTSENSGYYNLGYRANSSVSYKYTGPEYSSNGSGYQHSFDFTAKRDDVCELLIESNNRGNRITVSAAKTLRSLYLGSTTTVELDGNDSETLEFSAPDDGDYIFLSEGAESEYANLYDSNGNHLAYGNIGSGENNNFRIICNLKAYEKVRLEVHNVDWYSANCDVMVYRYIQNEATVNQNGYTQEISIASSQEVWLKLTAEEDGFYEFSCDYYNIDMTLYEMNDDDLGDVLGSDYTIKTWLDAGTTVMLRTYYYSHSSGTYTITIEPGEITEVEGNWTIYSSSGTSSRNLRFESGCEAVISCTFNTGGVYTFYSEDEEVVIELYVNDEDAPKVSGNSIKFEYDPDEIRAVTMRIHKGTKYQAFNGYIYYSYEYAHKEYDLALGTPQEVSVPSGSEAWFNFTAPKAGLYKFSSSESYIYKSLYDTNGELLGNKSNTSDDIERYLDEGQQVQLKTYYSSHAECAYTISVSEAEVISLTPGSNEEKELPYGETQWYSFTADSDAEYEFEFRNNSSGSGYVYLYESLGADSNLDYRNIYSNNSYNSKKELTTDQTIYWKVVSAISPVADITIKMKKVEDVIIPLEDENGNGVTSEIYKGSTQWYSFTSEEDMIYVFTFTGDNTSTISASLYEDKDGSSVTSISLYSSDEFKKIERYIEAGSTVFWKVSNSYNNANITIKAEKRRIDEMSDGQYSVSIASGQEHLFKYTADESTRYIFTFTSTCESRDIPSIYRHRDLKLDSCEASIWWTSSGTDEDENDNYVYTGISECYIQEGETVYWEVNNSGYYSNDVNISAKVEKIVINKWPETAEDAPVSVAPNEEKWFSYTAATGDEEARYTFTFEYKFESGGSSYDCKAFLYKELGSNSPVENTASSSGEVYKINTGCYLTPGETIYWKIKNTNNSSSAFNVDMKAEQVIVNDLTLTEGSDNAIGNEFEVAANAEQWFKFTSEETARYAFTFTADIGDLYNQYCRPYLYKSLDGASYTTFDPAYHYDYVNLGSHVNDQYIGTESWYVEDGNTIYWKVTNTHSSSPVKGTIKIVKINVIDFAQAITDTGIEMAPGDEQWIRYTADHAARYRFVFRSNIGSTIRAYLYDALEAESKMDNNSLVTFNSTGKSYDYYLEPGNTIYWRLLNNANASANVKVEVVPIIAEELSLGGEGKEFAIEDDNDHRWITFTAPEIGIYSFKIDCSSSDGYLETYVDMASASPEKKVDVSANSTYTIQYSLGKGRTIYLRVRRSGFGTFEATLQVEQIQAAQTLILGTGSEVSIDVNTFKYQWLEFTAPEDGIYKFYSEGESDPKAWFLDSVYINYSDDYYSMIFYDAVNDDYSGTDNNFSKNFEMQSGQSIYVLVGYKFFNQSLETTVYVENMEVTVTALELGEGTAVSVESGHYELLEFTAPSDGTYRFYSNDYRSGDPYAWFFGNKCVGNDADTDMLDSYCTTRYDGYGYNDDGGDNYNFAKDIALTSGQSIYIAAGTNGLGSTSNYIVYAEKLESTEE